MSFQSPTRMALCLRLWALRSSMLWTTSVRGLLALASSAGRMFMPSGGSGPVWVVMSAMLTPARLSTETYQSVPCCAGTAVSIMKGQRLCSMGRNAEAHGHAVVDAAAHVGRDELRVAVVHEADAPDAALPQGHFGAT